MTKPMRLSKFVLDDLDIAILKALPAFGSKHGKYLDDGIPVNQLPRLVDPELTSYFLGGRIRSLAHEGYVYPVKNVRQGAGASYQRTEKGDAAVKPKLRDAAEG